MMSFKSYTLPRLLAMLLATLWLCSSCIDEFDADLPDADLHYLVVQGSICGQSDCEFHLSRSLPLNPSSDDLVGRNITDARLTVCGSDNSRVSATQPQAGLYLVTLGALNSNQEYWIEIEWEGRTYQSSPTRPLSTPTITDLHYEQPRADQQVDILITPATDSQKETQYLQWDYQEHWEIHTPYLSEWDYNVATDKIEPATVYLDKGWMKDLYHPSVIGNNIDFANHEIRNLRLLSLNNLDDRFNVRYCITVRQRAISREQFEYEKLAQRQSDDMGGLFTPQPSELPSNIRCNDGQSKSIGYIGVTLNAEQKRLYIKGKDVGYHTSRIAHILTDEEVSQLGPDAKSLYSKTYRILNYDEMTNAVTWVERWGVDATAWGASLEKPDFWTEN